MTALAFELPFEDEVLAAGISELLAAEGSAVAYRVFDVRHPAAESILVAVNAGGVPARLTIERADLTGSRAEQVSWPGREWRTTFAPRLLGEGPLVVDVEAREGVAVRVAPAL